MWWADWKFSARLAAQDRIIRWLFAAGAVMVMGMGAFFLWRLVPEGRRAGVITLHYNVYLGIDDVRPWPWLFAIPAFALGALIIDAFVAIGLYRRHPLAAKTLMSVGAVSLALWAVGSFFIILVNL